MDREYLRFVWDTEKEALNIEKHNVSFMEALAVFRDPNRKIIVDELHSQDEERYFCIGMVKDKLITVRFTYRGDKVRIIGAGYWRMGKEYYYE